LTDTEFNSDSIKTNGLSEEKLLDSEDSIYFEPKNCGFQIKPLGDINIKLEDIIPCKYKDLTFYILKLNNRYINHQCHKAIPKFKHHNILSFNIIIFIYLSIKFTNIFKYFNRNLIVLF